MSKSTSEAIEKIAFGILPACIIGIASIYFDESYVYIVGFVISFAIIAYFIRYAHNNKVGESEGPRSRFVSHIPGSITLLLIIVLSIYLSPPTCEDLPTSDAATRFKIECIDISRKIVRLSLFNQHGFLDTNIFANIGYIEKTGNKCMTIRNVTNSIAWTNFIRGNDFDLPLGDIDPANSSSVVFLSNKFVQDSHQMPVNSNFFLKFKNGDAPCPN